jgi:hypothetical protein
MTGGIWDQLDDLGVLGLVVAGVVVAVVFGIVNHWLILFIMWWWLYVI